MMTTLTIALLGGSGNVGGHYATAALEAGHSIRALARNVDKLAIADHSDVTAIQGDATSASDVGALIDGADVVVSCVGNPNKQIHIMEATANNILSAAAKIPSPPRCIFISSMGCGGSSWLLAKVLGPIGGRASWVDYEAADLRIRDEKEVPFVLLRPYGMNDKPGKGTYKISGKSSVTFALPIPKADVAKFLLDATTDNQWDGPAGVQLTGA
jgi:nucleoside-diphosphate-sugar epimerase